jgi:hypothetical protein
VPALCHNLTLLDISRSDDRDMHGSVDSITQLTALRHLNAYGSPIGAHESAAVCGQLCQLSQLTFLSIGSVHRKIMKIKADGAAQLSQLTTLVELQLQGAVLGPNTDKLAWLSALTRLTSLR